MNAIIRIRGLRKSYIHQQRELPILQIDSWTVRQGERVALLGPSGSGKSTLLHLIGGVLPADQGELEVAGQCLTGMSEKMRDRFRARTVGYVFQDFHLIPSLTARHNVEWVLPRELANPEKARLLDQWFERVGLAGHMHRLPSQLSRGQQQRVAIIRALINRPPLVLADEPTGSLDWETASEIMRLLLEVCAETGSTLLTVTHDQHLARYYPRVVQMSDINRGFLPQQAVGGEVR